MFRSSLQLLDSNWREIPAGHPLLDYIEIEDEIVDEPERLEAVKMFIEFCKRNNERTKEVIKHWGTGALEKAYLNELEKQQHIDRVVKDCEENANEHNNLNEFGQMLKEHWPPTERGMDMLDKCLLSVEEFYDEGDNLEDAEKKNKVLNEKKEDMEQQLKGGLFEEMKKNLKKKYGGKSST